MAAIQPGQVVQFTDKIAAWFLAVRSSLGNGTTGASAKAGDLQALVFDLDDYEQTIVLLQPSEQVRVSSLADTYAPSVMSVFLAGLNTLCAKAGITGVNDLNTFATHFNLNTTTKWQCLFHPDFAELYALWRNGAYPSAHNVYFEVLQGTTYPNGLRRLIVGTGQTAGHTIDSAKYAGGFAQLKWTGVSGSGTVQVSGVWRKTDGTTDTGTGTVSVSGASGTATVTPPFANALLLSCNSITAAAGITAGTLYAEAARPSGRANPPT